MAEAAEESLRPVFVQFAFDRLLPSFAPLGLYASYSTYAAGYYGIEPADVQFSILAYYSGLVSFFPFDPRHVHAPRQRHDRIVGKSQQY